MEKTFNGVEYSFPISYLIIGNQENSGVRDDASGSTGSIGHSDEYLDEQMLKSSKSIDDLLIKKCNE